MRNAIVIEDIYDISLWLNQRLSTVFSSIEVTNCSSVEEARTEIEAMPHINLALVDLGLPDGCGTEIIELLRQKSHETYIIVTTIFDDDEHVFNSLKLGANGYLLKDLSEPLFEERLKGLMLGHPPLSSSIARRIIQYFGTETQKKLESDMSASSPLTEREKEILQLVAKGFSRKEIAKILNLSSNTIAKYITFIYKKLNISSKSEATLEAVKIGLVEL